MSRFFDLSFEQLPSGEIRLRQDSLDDASVIDLHPWQLRAVAEHFGLVPPSPLADELTKKLAEQICRVYLSMFDDYRHLSHIMEEEFARLDGFIDALPDAVFPRHLWDEREERERVATEARALRQAQAPKCLADNDDEPAPAENKAHGEQLGLEV